MFEIVTLPFWLLLVLAFFAIIGLVDRVFAPGVKWFFRRRLNTAIDELNARLDLGIQPFKLTRKQSLVDQLMYDPKVLEAVEADAKEHDIPRAVAIKKAESYAKEIIPSFSPMAYFGFGTKISRWISQFIYRVRLGYSDDEAMKNVDHEATVVFVMNHRSNMDYVLVTYMASARASLSYAVGEWARVWGLQGMIKAMGAYFIRRSSNNNLYRRVLAQYVHMATQQGVTQAVFPEGGLSRDGLLREPKLGLISYMISDFDPDTSRDIVFIPVGINYDRVIEDRILTRNQEKELTGRTFKVGIGSLLGLIGHLFSLRFSGKLYRLGYACVSFGHPISLKSYCNSNKFSFAKLSEKKRQNEITDFGTQLLDSVGKVIPALPVSLVAAVMVDNETKKIGELELKAKVFELIAKLEKKHVHVHIPRTDRDYAVSTGLRMLTLRHLVTMDEDGLYSANPKEMVLLHYYTNSIAHLLG